MRKQMLLLAMPILALLLPATLRSQATMVDPSNGTYECTFEEIEDFDYWRYANSSENAWYIGPAAARSGELGLYISNDQGQTNAYTQTNEDFVYYSYAYLTVDMSEAGEYGIEFDWRCNGQAVEYNLNSGYSIFYKDYLRVYLVPQSTLITAISSPDSWTTISEPLYNHTSWQHFAGSTNISEQDKGTYYVVFAWTNDNQGGLLPPAAVDNIKIRKVNCVSPTNMVITDTTATAASISWEGDATSGDYDIYLNGEYYDNTMNPYYDFANLLSNHFYTVDVYANCYDDETSMPVSGNFRTSCGSEMGLPFFEDWEHVGGDPSNSEGIWPDCWDSVMRHSSYTAVCVAQNYTNDGHYSMRMVCNGDSNLMVSKMVPVDGDRISISFAARLNTNAVAHSLQVGVIEDPDDISTYEPLLTITSADNMWHTYELNTSDMASSATYYIAFLHSSTTVGSTAQQAFIDDIKIYETPDCPTPDALYAEDITANSVQLRWNTTWAGNYEVVVSATDSIDEASDAIVTPVGSGDTIISVSGLSPMTLYHAWVRSVCDDYSPWREAALFATTCADDQCEVEVQLQGEAFTNYHASIDIMQNGHLIANTAQDRFVKVCSTLPVVITYNGAEYHGYNATAHVAILDGVGDTMISTYGQDIMPEQSIGNACPNCYRPTGLTVTEVTETSLQFEWDANDAAIGYRVAFNGTAAIDIEEPFYYADQLLPGTDYYIEVTTRCDEDTESPVRHFAARTACAAMTIPYRTDFDGMTAAEPPACWHVMFPYNVNPAYPCVMSGGVGGSQGLRFVGYGTYSMLATPAVPLAGNEINVVFDAKIHGNGSMLTAGVMTDPADSSTYTPLVSVVANDSYSTYRFSTADLDASTTYYVAFRYYGATNGQYADVDNFTIRLDDGCLAPTTLQVAEVYANSITVEWDEVEAWSYYVLQYGAVDSAFSADIDVAGLGAYSINNLAANTLYRVRVGTVCTIDTLWQEVLVRTLCGEMQLPYTETWEGTPAGTWPTCWDSTLAHGNAPVVSNWRNHTATGNNSLSMIASADHNMAVSGEVPLAGNSVNCSFWAYMPAESTGAVLKAGVIADPRDTTTFIALAEVTTTGGQWVEYEFATTGLDAATSYRVAFLYYAPQTDTAYIDDIVIAQATGCSRPSAATVAQVDATSATLQWAAAGSGYEVRYGTSPTVDDATLQTVLSSTNSVTLNGLQQSTLYYAWVRTNCGDEVSQWRTFGQFTTPCASDACQLTVHCEDVIGAGWDDYAALMLRQNNVERASLRVNIGHTADFTVDSICPGVPLHLVWQPGTTESDAGASFVVRNSNGAICAVENASLLRTDAPFDTIDDACTAQPIDDPFADCLDPRDIEVPDNGLMATGAVVAWLPGRASDTAWVLTLNGQSRNINERPYVLHNLTPNTNYQVSVATLCPDGSTSNSISTTFRTPAENDNQGIATPDGIGIALYPNPTTSTTTLVLPGQGLVTLCDVNGRTLYTTTACNSTVLDLGRYGTGTYFVHVATAEGTAVRKLLVR